MCALTRTGVAVALENESVELQEQEKGNRFIDQFKGGA
jgi:hypothetical protein